MKAPASPAGSTRVKRRLRRVLFACGALGVGGFLVSASGVIPVSASSGHWAVTRWFLEFTKERSVATRTLTLRAPAWLDDESLVLKGAGHYETGCRQCHGAPGVEPPRIVRAMTPAPPPLMSASADWDAGELFYIVKHGVKMTGMPAWPAQERDDEVWAMVAFLRALPGLDEAGYRRLVSGEALGGDDPGNLRPLEGAPGTVIESCARCHGHDGRGRGGGAFPSLAGQKPRYLLGSLEAYARGERHSGMMEPVAEGLTPDTMRELAHYYAGLRGPPASAVPAHDAEQVERGRMIALEGVAGQRVPACAACHGPGPTERNPVYPRLAGQHADYLVLQLELFGAGDRGGTEYAHLMRFVATGLTSEQREDVARYYASLDDKAKGDGE